MVNIITDSAADFEPDELKRLHISCIPLRISFGDNEYCENINLSKDKFYHLLENAEEFPKTSQPSPSDLENVFKSAQARGEETVAIMLSSALSGTYQSTVMIKNNLAYENCYVIDGLTATGGQRILVEYAVRLRDKGKTAKEIAKAVSLLRSRVTLYACMDTLEYLHKGGRISGTAYTIGTIGNIKPLVHITKEGCVEIPKKTMGMKRGIDYLCQSLNSEKPDNHFPVYVMYTQNRKNGELLAEELKKHGYKISPNHIINVGAAIGSHIGPNACGIVYISEKSKE